MSGPAISRMSRSSARPPAPTPRRMRTACVVRRALGAPEPEIVRELRQILDGKFAELVDGGVFIEAAQERLGGWIDGAILLEGGPRPGASPGNELIGGDGKLSAYGGVHGGFPSWGGLGHRSAPDGANLASSRTGATGRWAETASVSRFSRALADRDGSERKTCSPASVFEHKKTARRRLINSRLYTRRRRRAGTSCPAAPAGLAAGWVGDARGGLVRCVMPDRRAMKPPIEPT